MAQHVVCLVLVAALAVACANGQAAYFYGDSSCTDLVVSAAALPGSALNTESLSRLCVNACGTIK